MTQLLEGKTAIITGAGQGVGRGIAEVLAAQGAAVVITDVDDSRAGEAAAAIGGSGGRALPVHQNVLDLSSWDAVFTAATEHFGSADILVNNAGVASQKPLSEVTEKDWDLTNDINAKAVFFGCQAAGRYFGGRGGGGKIVNVSSMVGKNAIPEYAPYNASKAAVISITQSAALEFASFDVNVNAVCPGIVRTPLWDALDPAQWDRQIERVPLGRGQMPDDIGYAVAFLASEWARNITGAAVPVTGGLQMW